MTCVVCNLLPYGKCDYHAQEEEDVSSFQDRCDEVMDLICDPESEFYTLAHWDESGRVAACATLNAPIAKEIAERVRGVEALDSHELRIPYNRGD